MSILNLFLHIYILLLVLLPNLFSLCKEEINCRIFSSKDSKMCTVPIQHIEGTMSLNTTVRRSTVCKLRLFEITPQQGATNIFEFAKKLPWFKNNFFLLKSHGSITSAYLSPIYRIIILDYTLSRDLVSLKLSIFQVAIIDAGGLEVMANLLGQNSHLLSRTMRSCS